MALNRLRGQGEVTFAPSPFDLEPEQPCIQHLGMNQTYYGKDLNPIWIT